MKNDNHNREPYWHPPIISVDPVIINTPTYRPSELSQLLEEDPDALRILLDHLKRSLSTPPQKPDRQRD